MILYCAASLVFLDVKMHIERDAGAAVGAQKLRTRWGILVILTNLGTVECPFVYQQDLVKQIRACPKIFGLLQRIFEEAANTRGNKSGSEAIEKFVVKRWYECFLVSLLPKRKAMLFTKPTRRYVCVKCKVTAPKFDLWAQLEAYAPWASQCKEKLLQRESETC
jgi:hypothetical protein